MVTFCSNAISIYYTEWHVGQYYSITSLLHFYKNNVTLSIFSNIFYAYGPEDDLVGKVETVVWTIYDTEVVAGSCGHNNEVWNVWPTGTC